MRKDTAVDRARVGRPEWRAGLAGVALLLAAALALLASAGFAAAAADEAEPPAATIATIIAGNKVATETWRLTAGAEGARDVEATIEGGGRAQRMKTTVAKDGTATFTVVAGGMQALTATLGGGKARVRVTGQDEKQIDTRASLFLENLVWHQFLFLLDSYDTAKGGEQIFTAFLPSQGIDFTLKVERTGALVYTVAGKSVTTQRWKIAAPQGVAMDVWSDGSGSPLLVLIPIQSVKAVRAGFEGLAEAALAGAPQAPAPKPPSYARADAFREKDVTVGEGEWALPGTLTLPAGEGRRPALVLVHGSGPNDRDETIGPNKPFRDIAWGLATKGIAVLRYDKRTRVHGAKMASMAERLTVKEETVDDALSAVALLARTPGVDPDRIFLLGHSLGGMLVPRIAARGPRVAGYIVMAGTTRPLEEVYLEQVRWLMGLDGEISPSEKEKLAEIERQNARLKDAARLASAGPADLPLGLPAAYWKDLQGYRPAEAAKVIESPMLILQGERDYQVTMTDYANWKSALASRKDVTFKTYPTLNHLFIEGEGRSTPQEYGRPANVAKEVIDDIAAWMPR